jgi:hypothetical protein
MNLPPPMLRGGGDFVVALGDLTGAVHKAFEGFGLSAHPLAQLVDVAGDIDDFDTGASSARRFMRLARGVSAPDMTVLTYK